MATSQLSFHHNVARNPTIQKVSIGGASSPKHRATRDRLQRRTASTLFAKRNPVSVHSPRDAQVQNGAIAKARVQPK